MTDFSKRGPNEAKTFELCEGVWNNPKFSEHHTLVANVMKMMWSASLPIEKIEAIACAVYGYDALDLRDAATDLTRAKILRSSTHQGKRHYEVNY